MYLIWYCLGRIPVGWSQCPGDVCDIWRDISETSPPVVRQSGQHQLPTPLHHCHEWRVYHCSQVHIQPLYRYNMHLIWLTRNWLPVDFDWLPVDFNLLIRRVPIWSFDVVTLKIYKCIWLLFGFLLFNEKKPTHFNSSLFFFLKVADNHRFSSCIVWYLSFSASLTNSRSKLFHFRAVFSWKILMAKCL